MGEKDNAIIMLFHRFQNDKEKLTLQRQIFLTCNKS